MTQPTLFPASPGIIRSAVISDCGKYRYSLTRVWDKSAPLFTVIMLNPSTADASIDDPTIRSVVRLTKAAGAGGICVVRARTARWDRVLAIDPGCAESAFVVYDVASKSIPQFGKMENQQLVDSLHLNQFLFSVAVIERISSYGMPVGREVFETCEWVGRFAEAIERATRIVPTLIYRKDVKLCLCGNHKAKDPNVRQALIDLFGQTEREAIGTKKAPGKLYGITKDCWAALGLAITCASREHASPQKASTP